MIILGIIIAGIVICILVIAAVKRRRLEDERQRSSAASWSSSMKKETEHDEQNERANLERNTYEWFDDASTPPSSKSLPTLPDALPPPAEPRYSSLGPPPEPRHAPLPPPPAAMPPPPEPRHVSMPVPPAQSDPYDEASFRHETADDDSLCIKWASSAPTSPSSNSLMPVPPAQFDPYGEASFWHETADSVSLVSPKADAPAFPSNAVRFGKKSALEAEQEDEVTCSLYGPAKAKRGSDVLIQVFAHATDKATADEVREQAVEADSEATRRGATGLALDVAKGSRLRFELSFKGIALGDCLREVIWRGTTRSLQYSVEVPTDLDAEKLVGSLAIFLDTIPVGQIHFHISLQKEEVNEKRDFLGAARPVHKVFMSYSSKDRAEVLKRSQGFLVLGIDVFQDAMSLRPGDLWEQTLIREIDNSDLMILCWSNAASQSEWVTKEWSYALKQRGDLFIKPLPIEKPIPPPPSELSHLHFNDWMLSVIRDEESSSVNT